MAAQDGKERLFCSIDHDLVPALVDALGGRSIGAASGSGKWEGGFN